MSSAFLTEPVALWGIPFIVHTYTRVLQKESLLKIIHVILLYK